MKNKVVVILACMFFSTLVFAQKLEDDWNDFLHYTVIGRFDLAAGFAQKIIESKPNPIELLKLSEDNPSGYAILVKVHADNPDLAPLAAQILDIIEKGRFIAAPILKSYSRKLKDLAAPFAANIPPLRGFETQANMQFRI